MEDIKVKSEPQIKTEQFFNLYQTPFKSEPYYGAQYNQVRVKPEQFDPVSALLSNPTWQKLRGSIQTMELPPH